MIGRAAGMRRSRQGKLLLSDADLLSCSPTLLGFTSGSQAFEIVLFG
jgi:hypothetical protein